MEHDLAKADGNALFPGSLPQPPGQRQFQDDSPDPNQHKDQTMTYHDGSTYTGQFKDNKRSGSGTWRSTTGEYVGEWRRDQQDGFGTQTWKDGRVFEGQFREGSFHGNGRMEWRSEHGLKVFEGQYVNGTKNGLGKFEWPDGRSYDGEWVEGKRHGTALYVNARGERKRGVWTDDKLTEWIEHDVKE